MTGNQATEGDETRRSRKIPKTKDTTDTTLNEMTVANHSQIESEREAGARHSIGVRPSAPHSMPFTLRRSDHNEIERWRPGWNWQNEN